MLGTTWRTWFTGSLAAAALAVGAASAQAGWGSSGGGWGGSSGGWGGWGSSGGSWGGSRGGGHWGWRKAGWHRHGGSWGGWGSSGGGGWGSSGGWGRASYGSNGGSWGGGWGSSGGYGHYGSNGGAAGATYYGPAETRVEGTPAEPTPADKPTNVPPPTLDKTTPGPNGDKKASINSTILTVSVPVDAKVFVNGKETTTPGNERQYISRNLVPGYRYSYRIRAEVIRDGEPVTETKIVEVQSGETARVDFDLGTEVAKTKSATKLTVHVPENAKLFLAGRETRSTGSSRTFSTGMLDGDNAWENYTIRAVANLDGRTVTKEKTITLHAGQHQEVTFDFDTTAPTLAAATGEAVR